MRLPPNVDEYAPGRFRYRWQISDERSTITFTAHTIAEVWERWAGINTEIRNTAGMLDTSMTVVEWRDRWLDTRLRTRARNTWRTSRQRTERFTAAYGLVKMRDVTTVMFDDHYTELAGLGLADTTVAGTHTELRVMFNAAVRKHVIPHNPIVNADAPLVRLKPRDVWTPAEVAVFETAAKTHRFYPLWRLALHTGMRREEYAHLRWSDIHGNRVLVTRRVVDPDGQVMYLDGLKGGVTGRTVTIDDITRRVLLNHRKVTRQRLFKLGVALTDQACVCVKPDGTPFVPSTLTRDWRRLVLGLPVPYIPMNHTRHTWATIALAAGEEVKVVSERLGHANTSITTDMYAQVTQQSEHRAASVLSDAMGE